MSKTLLRRHSSRPGSKLTKTKLKWHQKFRPVGSCLITVDSIAIKWILQQLSYHEKSPPSMGSLLSGYWVLGGLHELNLARFSIVWGLLSATPDMKIVVVEVRSFVTKSTHFIDKDLYTFLSFLTNCISALLSQVHHHRQHDNRSFSHNIDLPLKDPAPRQTT